MHKQCHRLLTLLLIASLLGSALAIGPTLLPVFEQLGIYDEFVSIGKYLTHAGAFKETLKPYRASDYRPVEE